MEVMHFQRKSAPRHRDNNRESLVQHCSCTSKRNSQIAVGGRGKETATAVGRHLAIELGRDPEACAEKANDRKPAQDPPHVVRDMVDFGGNPQ